MFGFFSSAVYEDLNGAEFRQKFEATPGAILLDVRTPGEFMSGNISGATNIDIMSPDFERKISALDKGKEYFIYCRSGNRSGRACEILASKGMKAYNLAGGIGAWPR